MQLGKDRFQKKKQEEIILGTSKVDLDVYLKSLLFILVYAFCFEGLHLGDRKLGKLEKKKKRDFPSNDSERRSMQSVLSFKSMAGCLLRGGEQY